MMGEERKLQELGSLLRRCDYRLDELPEPQQRRVQWLLTATGCTLLMPAPRPEAR